MLMSVGKSHRDFSGSVSVEKLCGMVTELTGLRLVQE